MTKEQIQERIDKLTAERDNYVRLVHVYNGAIEDCQFWMLQLETSAEVDKKKK